MTLDQAATEARRRFGPHAYIEVVPGPRKLKTVGIQNGSCFLSATAKTWPRAFKGLSEAVKATRA